MIAFGRRWTVSVWTVGYLGKIKARCLGDGAMEHLPRAGDYWLSKDGQLEVLQVTHDPANRKIHVQVMPTIKELDQAGFANDRATVRQAIRSTFGRSR